MNRMNHILASLALAGLSLLGSASPLLAQNRAKDAQIGPDVILKSPLPIDHPAAQLEPGLRDVPPIPAPQYGTYRFGLNAFQATREVEYNTFSGSARVGRPAANLYRMNGNSAQLQEGHPGANASMEFEPSGQIGVNSVIGSDDRVKISATTSYPWRAVCKLYMKFPNGKTYVGSGSLIAAKYVLTAGHCVYSSGDGGWATQIKVIPGLKGSYKPYGSAWATKMRTYTGWTQYASGDHDFALVTLDRNIGNSTGWFGYGWWSSIAGVTGNLAGYPGDRDSGLQMYYHYGAMLETTDYQVQYTIDTYGGQSGSPVWRILSGSRYVMAVHTWGGSSRNGGTRINATKFNSLQSWIATGN